MRVLVGTQNTFQVNSIEVWLSNVEQEAFSYNTGYSIYGNNYIQTLTPFDPNKNTLVRYGSRAIWTNPKPAGSLVDDYRTIPPLNFYDFPIENGDITSHLNINRRLMFIQPLNFSLKYFNSEGQFVTTSLDNIVLGENAVMSRREQDLSSFGSRHKQSISKGRTESGSDTLYWVCSDYKKIMRFGADGTTCISDRARIKSWCENNILDEFNTLTTSTTGLGISSVWNQKDKEYLITLRYGTNVSIGLTLSKTIAFNEVTNRFTSFFDFFPTIYIRCLSYFLTPNSINYAWYPNDSNPSALDTGDVYLHNDDMVIGNVFFPTYYDAVTPQTNVELTTNANVIDNKLFQNFGIDYEGDFTNVTFTTKTQTSGMGDNEYALDLFRGQVGLDINEDPLNGIWIKSLVLFGSTQTTKLKRFAMKFMNSNRLTQN